MLADQVTAMLLELKGQKDANGRPLTPPAVACLGLRKLEFMCMAQAANKRECDAAILRFRKSVSAPIEPRRFLQLEAKLEALRDAQI